MTWWQNDQLAKGGAEAGDWWAKDAPVDGGRDTVPGMRGLGLGTRNAVEGFANVASIFTDPVAAALNATLGTDIRSLRDTVPEALTAAGLPKPETEGERLMARAQREVAGVIPTMGAGLAIKATAKAPEALNVARALTEKPVVQAIGAAGSGLASQVAAESGADPWLEAAAGIGGSIAGMGAAEGLAAGGRAVRALVQPFTQAGRERIATDALLRSSADPEGLASRIQAGLDDTGQRLPGSPVTTAQAARDPGLMVTEQGLRADATRLPGQGGMSGAAAFRDVDAQRSATRAAAMQSMADDLTPETRGAQIRDALAQQEQAAMPGGPGAFALARLRDQFEGSESFYDNLDTLARQRSEAARPLYEKAFAQQGIHSDRLAQFLDDPVIKQGLSRGLEIQRLEALAEGRQFNPKDYAVTRFNDAGDPVIGAVPNMRLLDAAKRGLDDILDGYRDPTTGRLALDQRGRAIERVRQSLVSTLDGLNPDYKAARQAWGGPSQGMAALEAGRDALRLDPEQIAKRFAGMSDTEKDFFKAGLYRELQDKFSSAKTPDAAYRFLADPKTADKLAAVFGRGAIDDISAQLQRQAQTFGRDETGANAVGQILRRDATGAPMLADSAVATNALRNPQAVDATLRAAGADAPRVRSLLRGQFIENMLASSRTTGAITDARGNVSDVLSPAQFKRFFDGNAGVAQKLFDADQMAGLQRLANDFRESMVSATTAKARGSDTAQNLTVANLIGSLFAGSVDPSNPLAQALVGIGPVMRMAYSAPEAATKELLIQAAIDPRFAKALLDKAGPESMRRAAEYLSSTTGQRFRDALGRMAIRTEAQSAVSERNQARPPQLPMLPPGAISQRPIVPPQNYTGAMAQALMNPGQTIPPDTQRNAGQLARLLMASP